MAEHDFTIRFRVDNADAKRVHAAEAAAYRQRIKDANDAAKAVAAAGTKEADDRKRVMKVVADAEKEQAKARVAAAKEVDAANRAAAKEAEESAKKAAKGWDGASSMAAGFLKTIGGLGAAQLGFSGISSILDAIGESFKRARDQAEGAGKFATEYRETLKEIASLKGESAPTAAVVRADLDFRKETLQDQAGARGTQEGFLNSAAIAIDTKDTQKKMSQVDADVAQKFAGRMHARIGGEGSAFGTLAGIIPAMEGGMERVSGEHTSRRLAQMFEIGSMGAAGAAQFAEQLAGAQGLASTGAYSDPARMAAMGSLVSLENPAKITTALQQLHHLTAGGRLDETGGKGSEMSPKDYFASIGVTNQDDDLTMLQKMFGETEVAEAKEKAKGLKLNMAEHMKIRGFEDQEDVQRFSAAYGNRASLRNTLLPMADRMPTMEQADAKNVEFASSVLGRTQAERVDDDRTKIALGGGSMEYAQTLGRRAHKSLQAANTAFTGTYEEQKDSKAVRNEMIEIQREELTRLGQDVKRTTRYSSTLGSVDKDPLAHMYGGFFSGKPGTKESANMFAEQGLRIAGLGGDPLGGGTRRVQAQRAKTTAELDKSGREEKLLTRSPVVEILTEMNQKMNPPAIQVAVPGGANAGRVR